MREIFADSFYWIALANPADQWHRAVKEFNQANQDLWEMLNLIVCCNRLIRASLQEISSCPLI